MKKFFVVLTVLAGCVFFVISGNAQEPDERNPMKDGVPNVLAKPGLDTSRRVEMTCGGTRVELICGYNKDFRQSDDRICSNNTLIFTLPDGEVVLPKPTDWEEVEKWYTPISVSCRHEKENPDSFYIYTRYLSGSYNCMKADHNCNVEVLYSPEGEFFSTYSPDYKIRLDDHMNTISIEDRRRDYPIDYMYKKDDE